jgi:hypothetical protein
MDRDGLDAQFLAGADDPERDLAAVCYQNFFEHENTPNTNSKYEIQHSNTGLTPAR